MPASDELGSWADLPPGELFDNIAIVRKNVAVTEAWKALAYARRSPSGNYDELAYRVAAATPCRGAVPAQSIGRTIVERDRDRESSRIRRLRREHHSLRPRALDVPYDHDRMRYEFTDDTLDFFVERSSRGGGRVEESWSVGRAHPPKMLLDGAVPRDAALTLNQRYSIELRNAAWLPLAALIDVGEILPRQRWDGRLRSRMEAEHLYLFISHRWRTPDHPDPDGREASLLAWQLVDYLCEAVLIAARRGLHSPRMYAPVTGQFIGIAGRELAESLIVNVLRPCLADAEVTAAAAEAGVIEPFVAGGVFEVAETDVGLGALRDLLQSTPTMRKLTGRICLWYDFASLPQVPRDADEEEVFQAGLLELGPVQMAGRTAVLIDTPEGYLARAWCTLEAVGANVLNQDLVLLHAQPRSTALGADVERYFASMMRDRPYVVRRAILDTSLFGLQTPARCFERLGIALTQTSDLISVYDLLRRMSHTPGIHVDNSSVVTGSWPLATDPNGNVVVPGGTPTLESHDDEDGAPGSLDWTQALVLAGTKADGAVPAHLTLFPGVGKRLAHVIVIAGCEGDAMLVAGWTRDHVASLEIEVDASVAAVSWISDDVVPVGHMACGRLEPVQVPADLWIIVAPSVIIEHGRIAARLLAAAAIAGLGRVIVEVDVPDGNVKRLAPPDPRRSERSPEPIPVASVDWRPIEGGVFGPAVQRLEAPLFQRPREAVPPEDLRRPPKDLQVLLINAVFQGDHDTTDMLCEAFPRTIDERFRSWMTVPEQLRQPDEAVRAYVDALVLIAERMGEMGFEGPLASLTATDQAPFDHWQDMLGSAEALAAQGMLEAANRELDAVLAEMEGLRGSAIDDLRPKILGAISRNHFHAGRIDQARETARLALDDCRRSGDEPGMSVYQQNLKLLDDVAIEDEAAVAAVSRAQQLSDQGRYEASNAILEALVLGPPTLVTCKVQGLMGCNHHWLGNGAAAAAHTREAVKLAEAIQDPDSVRVYAYNLKRIEGVDSGGAPATV